LYVPPFADSEMYTYLLTPKFTGDLRVNLELCIGDVCVASRMLRTNGTPSDRQPSTAKILVTMPMNVRVAEDTAELPAAAPQPVAARPASPPPPPQQSSGSPHPNVPPPARPSTPPPSRVDPPMPPPVMVGGSAGGGGRYDDTPVPRASRPPERNVMP